MSHADARVRPQCAQAPGTGPMTHELAGALSGMLAGAVDNVRDDEPPRLAIQSNGASVHGRWVQLPPPTRRLLRTSVARACRIHMIRPPEMA